MNASAWAGLIVATLSIIGSFVAVIRHLVKHYLAQLVPDRNGGHNLEGRIVRIEASQIAMEQRVDQILLALLK